MNLLVLLFHVSKVEPLLPAALNVVIFVYSIRPLLFDDMYLDYYNLSKEIIKEVYRITLSTVRIKVIL